MKKKIIATLIIYILLISNVNAIPFATIATTGLNFINPEIANIVNTVLCVSNPILCAQGKVVGYVSGQVYQQAYNAVSEVAGEEAAQSAAKAFDTYNQVKGYLDEGAEILNELEINEKGETNKGEIVFYEKGQDVGSLFGLENSDIFVENAQMGFNFEEVDGERQGYALANVNEGGRLWTTVLDENGNKIKRAYENIEGSFKLDKYGEIIEADFTTNEKGGSYIFTTTNTEEIDYLSGEPIKKSLLIDAPPNARVTYKDGEIKVYGKGKSFKLSQFSESNIMVSSNEITILDGDNVIIIGNKIIGKSFEGNGFKVDGLDNNLGEVTFSGNKIVNVGGKTKAIINGIEHKTDFYNLNLYYEEDFNPSSHINENYFNYGKDKIWLGGKGFTSSLKKGNEIFPEFIENQYEGSFSEREGRLEFTPMEGHLEITKTSPEGHPLALDIKSEGKFNIKNGKWDLEADGNNVYAGIESNPQFGISSDMKFNYLNNEGNKLNYDLDISSEYAKYLSEDDRLRIESEINTLENSRQSLIKKHNELLQNPKIKQIDEEIQILTSNIKELNLRMNQKDQEYYNLEKNLQETINEQQREQIHQQMEKISNEYDAINNEVKNLIYEKYQLVDSNEYKIVYNLKGEITTLTYEIDDKKLNLESGIGETVEGAFAQIISSEKNDAKITYSEFIECFPVIKNTDVKKYENLRSPTITGQNLDVLSLIVDSNYQTCADTQIELHSLYELQELAKANKDSIKFIISNGETLEYRNDRTYTMWDEKNKRVVTKNYNGNIGTKFDDWIANVQAYTNTGSLRSVLRPVNNINNLKPGDILTWHPNPKTGYGHTQGIKEILEIPPGSGQIYYRLFAGSDPAIDPRIYQELKNQNELINDIKSGRVMASTWEIEG